MNRRARLARLAAAGLVAATTQYWFLDRRMLRPYGDARYAVQLLGRDGAIIGEIPMPSLVRRGDMLVSDDQIPFPVEVHGRYVSAFHTVRVVDQTAQRLFTEEGYIRNPTTISPSMSLVNFQVGPMDPELGYYESVRELARESGVAL
jgi:hypothetical protein